MAFGAGSPSATCLESLVVLFDPSVGIHGKSNVCVPFVLRIRAVEEVTSVELLNLHEILQEHITMKNRLTLGFAVADY